MDRKVRPAPREVKEQQRSVKKIMRSVHSEIIRNYWMKYRFHRKFRWSWNSNISWPVKIEIKHISRICLYQIKREYLGNSNVKENSLN